MGKNSEVLHRIIIRTEIRLNAIDAESKKVQQDVRCFGCLILVGLFVTILCLLQIWRMV